ncbi:hypothetical protein [Leptospira kmetyi]|uniref:Uncharacterized protein n=1 Tax=Leptospira kmetyi TaxID=408139 RepID=A0ABX4N720_9LEPT|nr:hypothetical protein [Leptospira kmetyi]PJZ29111.1 hypothetical protein CH378_14590 [Leptospira kmetyi]PJZ39722.1 hypothetical protein CH370_19925 [Leptospira kmetyi]
MNYEKFIPTLIEETKSRFGNNELGKFLNFETENILIGVRGISILKNQVVSNDDSFDSFNDILFNIYPGGKSWGSRVVTIDPGKVSKETLEKYEVGGGEARTEEGLYLVKIGSHHGHVAFNQGSDFSYRRDQDGNHIWTKDDPLFKGRIGLNIHAQGTKKENVGVSSLGCTVTKATWEDSEWIELISVFQGAELRAKKLNPNFPGFCYAVFNQDTALKILNTR